MVIRPRRIYLKCDRQIGWGRVWRYGLSFWVCLQVWRWDWTQRATGTQTSVGCLCTTLSSGALLGPSPWWCRWVSADACDRHVETVVSLLTSHGNSSVHLSYLALGIFNGFNCASIIQKNVNAKAVAVCTEIIVVTLLLLCCLVFLGAAVHMTCKHADSG